MFTTFANDIDLLHWEPNLMIDAAGVAQTILSGIGDLSGTEFTISAGSLLEAHISNGHVIVLSGAVSGSYPIFSVDSANQLTLSVMYDELYPDRNSSEEAAQPWASESGNGLNFVIRTFWPQRKTVSALLLQAAGIGLSEVMTVVNPQVLRRPCALGALQMIYTALAAASEKPAELLSRAALYEKLYQRSLRGAMLEIDRDGDGVVELHRALNIVQLRRS